MPAEPGVLRAADLIDRPAYDLAGGYLGRVADLVVAPDGQGRQRITEVVVSPRPWGRLLGYEREDASGPWLVERFARRVLRRKVRRLPWSAVRIEDTR
jgi:hypothetical protein